MKFTNLESLMERFIDEGIPGCALSLSRKGKVVFECYKGLADLEEKRPIDKNTVYRVFSNTKVATATAALILYERGKFLLNDPVEKYLPFFADSKYGYYDGSSKIQIVPVSRPVQIKDLLTMTSGIPYGGIWGITQHEIEKIGSFLPNRPMTTMEYVEKLGKIPLSFDPGTHWNYGLSHDVVGALIEAVSGKSFGEFLSDEIFGPLNMDKTSFVLTDELRPHLAGLYTWGQNGKLKKDKFLDHIYEPEFKYESGGGGLLSTLGDMTRLMAMLSMGGTLDGVRILGRKTIDLMRENHLGPAPLADFMKTHEVSWPNLQGYGYGLGVRTMFSKTVAGSNGSVGEFGWSGAAGTWLMADVGEEISASYMHQLTPVENLQDYCHPRIRNVIYGALD